MFWPGNKHTSWSAVLQVCWCIPVSVSLYGYSSMWQWYFSATSCLFSPPCLAADGSDCKHKQWYKSLIPLQHRYRQQSFQGLVLHMVKLNNDRISEYRVHLQQTDFQTQTSQAVNTPPYWQVTNNFKIHKKGSEVKPNQMSIQINRSRFNLHYFCPIILKSPVIVGPVCKTVLILKTWNNIINTSQNTRKHALLHLLITLCYPSEEKKSIYV